MGEIDLGLDLIGFHTAGARGFCRRMGLPDRAAKMTPHLFRFVLFKGARVRLLLGDADFEQHIENRFAFDFQLPCQVVNSSLTHPLLFRLRVSRYVFISTSQCEFHMRGL
jgi:hypothetical protein